MFQDASMRGDISQHTTVIASVGKQLLSPGVHTMHFVWYATNVVYSPICVCYYRDTILYLISYI